jgi:undecaprenyl-diphosphatase
MGRVHRRAPWLLPVAFALFALLAVGAVFDDLPWDQPITDFVVDQRGADRNELAERVSWFGSTPVVMLVAAGAALVSFRRCPRLAIAVLVLALARPVAEFVIKEVIGRDRPPSEVRLVQGRGQSFPSGHPFGTAMSWGLLPYVVALFTRRRALWWATAAAVWGLVVGVAASRVWLGVHWTSDVVAGVLLAVLAVGVAERLMAVVHDDRGCTRAPPAEPADAERERDLVAAAR